MVVKKLPYKLIAGVVPCPGGWAVLPGRLHGVTVLVEDAFVLPTLLEVLDYRPKFDAMALHSPIGFASEPAGPYRECDDEARELLGWPRRNSIAPVPSKAALRATSREEVLRIEPWLTAGDVRRFKWLREVDAEVAPFHQRSVFSCHPELSYYMLNGDEPLRTSPFSTEGTAERLALVRVRMPGGDEKITAMPPKGAATHHLLQCAALLWSARRFAGRVINRLPLDPDWDETGRRMELVR
jgi:predicted RNase H-like nuclease